MARPKTAQPAYCHHKGRDLGYVRLPGQQPIYLGKFESDESREKYARVILEWQASGRRTAPAPRADEPADARNVNTIIVAYLEYVESYYTKPKLGRDGNVILATDGQPAKFPTSSVTTIKRAIALVAKMYGSHPVVEFGPLALKAVRQQMVSMKWARTEVNGAIGWIKTMFKWAASEELVNETIYNALATVQGLKAGRTEAHDPEPIKPVADHHVDQALPHVSRQVAAILRLMKLTGMRPGEACAMRTKDIDTTGSEWTYRPELHKMSYRGTRREIPLGPKAREIVAEWLRPNTSEFLFQPGEAMTEWRAARTAARKTPLNAGNRVGVVRGTAMLKVPLSRKRQAGTIYNAAALRKAVLYACLTAYPYPAEIEEPADADAIAADTTEAKAKRRAARKAWRKAHAFHPNQLRHSHATAIRKAYGIEAAANMLGHSKLDTVEIYAEKNAAAARAIAEAIG